MTSPIEELLAKGTDVRSCTYPKPSRTVFFESLSNEQLREHAAHTGPGHYERYDRAMLLALLHNRYPCGYFIELQEPPC